MGYGLASERFGRIFGGDERGSGDAASAGRAMPQGRRAPLGEGAGGVWGGRDAGPVSSTGEVVSRTARGRRASRAAGGEAQEDGAQGQDAARPETTPGTGRPGWRTGEQRGHEGFPQGEGGDTLIVH